jgi:hypothetical protein
MGNLAVVECDGDGFVGAAVSFDPDHHAHPALVGRRDERAQCAPALCVRVQRARAPALSADQIAYTGAARASARAARRRT